MVKEKIHILYTRLPNGKLVWYAGPREARTLHARLTPLPMVDDIIGDFVVDRVSPAGDSMTICAADLPFIESTDPRRIYVTPMGARVVFKRYENGRIVVWSYKAQNELSISPSTTLLPTDDSAQTSSAKKRRMTQAIFAAWVIAEYSRLNGRTISAIELTSRLVEAFPAANVQTRHGPHYLSQYNTGRLPEPPDTDPRNW